MRDPKTMKIDPIHSSFPSNGLPLPDFFYRQRSADSAASMREITSLFTKTSLRASADRESTSGFLKSNSTKPSEH